MTACEPPQYWGPLRIRAPKNWLLLWQRHGIISYARLMEAGGDILTWDVEEL